MNIEYIREYCLSKRGVTEDAAFGPEMILFRLCDKIFACLDLRRPNLLTVKMEEEKAVTLRERYRGISGAWHWNKRYWSDVRLDADVADDLIRELLDDAYEIIRGHLPQKSLYNFSSLPEEWVHEHFPVLNSSMTMLKSPEMQHIMCKYLLVTTDYQTAGRGQGTNTWESENGKNLLFSFRFYPSQIKATDQFLLLQCISVAMALTLEKYYKNSVKIKWPNDIYCEDRKICGILIEHDLCGQYILETRCGIGVNVNQKSFCSDAPNPVSLFQLLGKESDRAAILREFLNKFMSLYDGLIDKGGSKIMLLYMTRLYRLAGWYPFRDAKGDFEAHIYGVDEDGCLILMDRERNMRKYAHKEVEYLLSKKEYVPSDEEASEWLSMGL